MVLPQNPSQLTPSDLKAMARVRMKDAELLLRGRRFDGAAYLCGYALEMTLKARICKTLQWTHFKVNGNDYKFLKTHDLDFLLDFSGRSRTIRGRANFAN